MDNEEIMRRIKIHSAMFDKYEDIIEDKGIVLLARRYMELFFFELMKDNLKNESSKSKL
tara:strand:+ start:113 stop:289 length:177 start_codon:yes stop_codon:yes gene_type:complete